MRTLLKFLILLLPLTSKGQQKVDLLIFAKKIYTVNASFDTVTGIAIKNGRIIEAGNAKDLQNKYKGDKVLSYPNGYIYPGFIDAHCHFSGYALDGYKCDLVGTGSFEEVLNRVKQYERTNTLSWIYGRGWDQNDWTIKEYPDKEQLDKLYPDKIVVLKRIDGHAILCNQKALELAHIDENTTIKGGVVEKKNGKLTGILIDNAIEPVEALIPDLPRNEATIYLKAMQQSCINSGLTGVVDCGVKKTVIQLLTKLYKENILQINNSVLLSQDDATIDYYAKRKPVKTGRLQLNGIKVYADGSLGSRGACMLADYSDRPGHKGMMLTSYEAMDALAKKAVKYNWQLCTHAIGDSAIRTMLNLYGYHLKAKNDKRWRIEHAQVVNNDDYKKFNVYSVIPSVQPTHAISDMPWVQSRIGNTRMNGAYAYKALLNENGWIALGTDFPVEAINPLATFYTAVARKDKNGNPVNGFLPENALSREEALKGMTIWAAKSVFWENTAGSIESGKFADIVILDNNIMDCPEDQILTSIVLETVIHGKLMKNTK